MVALMPNPCQPEYQAMQKAFEDWEKAKRNTAEKLEIRTHRAILFYGGSVLAGGVIALAFVAAGATILAATTKAAVTSAISGSVGADIAGVITVTNNRFGLDEADRAYQDAVLEEGVAFGNYLTAKRRYNHCRKAHQH
jgi:hypothetical protein